MSRKLQIVSKIKNLSEGDKTWLIGFIEAAGRFTITQRGELAIGIIQGYENYAVLNKIREMVGFGAIVRQGARTFRYVVQDTEGMGELINMINGRLVLEKSISGPVGLGRLIEAYNKQNTNPIKQISRKVQPTWEDG